jgi:nucleoside-diphosphate-sugar epimerase
MIVGCGDVGLRAAQRLLASAARPRVIALTSQPERAATLRAAGITPIVGNLDAPRSVRRLSGLAPTVLHLAPPLQHGEDDPRTRTLIAALTAPRRIRAARQSAVSPTGRLKHCAGGLHGSPYKRGIVTDTPVAAGLARSPVRLVYASTTGVYGDCGGAFFDETRPVRPANARAKRRVAAERALRRASARGAMSASIVRIPGIYAADRLPLTRIERRTPALIDIDDVYTNHIHADDLAAILLRAAVCGPNARVFHASDDTVLKMGAYFDRIADAFGLERVPRISRADAERQLPSITVSFMRESRRLSNVRLKRELRFELRYASVDDFLRTVRIN